MGIHKDLYTVNCLQLSHKEPVWILKKAFFHTWKD